MADLPRSSTIALDEFTSFVVRRPTLKEMAAYRVSPAVQERMFDLLGRDSEGTLTDDERLEVDELIRFDRMMSLLKAKALKAIYDRGANS